MDLKPTTTWFGKWNGFWDIFKKHGSAVAGYGAFVYIGAKQGSQQMLELTDSRNEYCHLVF